MNTTIQNATRSGVFNLTQKLIGALTVGVGVATAFQASASFSLGDAANYAVIFQGGGGNTLKVNGGAGPSDLAVNGNVGIAGTGQLGLSGGSVVLIDGNVDFAGAVTPSSYSGGSSYVNGTISGGHAIVQNAMNYLSALSATLGAESGTPITLIPGTTINAAAGNPVNGDSVFTVTSMNFPNGTLTINGDGIHNVVINISGAVAANFHAEHVVLTGGLTSDQVLFNFFGGDSTTLSGGPTMNIVSGGGSPSNPDNILYGTFLDPYGTISISDTILYGRAFGGDSHNEQIVSGAYINAPPPAVPEPTTFIAGALLLLPFGANTLRILRRKATA